MPTLREADIAMTNQYQTMTDLNHADAVVGMMKQLYVEDSATTAPDPAKFITTVRELVQKPERGRIILCFHDDALHGYAILIP